jgi:type IV pilus assembly protein PilP
MMRSSLALLSILLLVVVSGCSKDEAPGTAPTVSDYAKARASSAAKIETAPSPAEQRKTAMANKRNDGEGNTEEGADDFGGSEGFRYDPDEHRDPFRSFIVDTLAAKQTEHSRGPLEFFDLSQLKLVAVVVSQDNPHALVYDPSGKGYIVSVGTKIGKRQGHIVEMSQSSMVVQETQEDVHGDMTARNIEMKIRHSEGG